MLKGRCAVITGSTQGLGYAMAERLAAEGCNIVMNGFGEKDEIESRRRKLESAHGVRAIHHGADVADAGQIADLVATARKTFGTLDVLINNAVVRYFSPIEEFKPADWDRALAVNLRPPSIPSGWRCPACASATSAASSTSPRSTACSPR